MPTQVSSSTGYPDCVVVGGGISGVCAAYALARAGVSVRLLERGALASMASGWSQGGVRQSGRHPAELPLARAAVARWAQLDNELAARLYYRRGGNYRLARNTDEATRIEAMVRAQRGLGLDLEFITDVSELRQRAPWCTDHVVAASFCASDGQADPVASVHAFAAAAERAGARIESGVEVQALKVDRRRVTGVRTGSGVVAAGCVVLATGVHTDTLLSDVGLSLPLRPHSVAVLQTVPLPPFMDCVFGTTGGDGSGRQEHDGRVRVTSGVQPLARNPLGVDTPQPTARVVNTVIEKVRRVLRNFDAMPVAQVWGGLIDQTPDALPVIDGDTGIDGLVVAAGFSGHGFALGPVTGDAVRDFVTGATPEHDLTPFRLRRFVAGQRAEPVTLHG